MRNFRSYDIWIDAKAIVKDVYLLLKTFPKEEQYALCDQLRRSCVSIPTNIAEGAGRESEQDFSRFLDISLGSSYEVETQLELSYDLGYISEEKRNEMIARLQSLEKRIGIFIDKLRQNSKKQK